MNRRIYLDNHATTPVDPRVLEAMTPYLTEQFGNPGSVGHSFGEKAREGVDAARARVAELLSVQPSEIVFTSGATESNNLAIRGTADRFRDRPAHFVSVSTEHKAVLDPLARLQKWGHRVTLLRPAQHDQPRSGRMDPQQVADALHDDTALVSIMLANNEIGVIQPLREIAEICHQRDVLLHCDATQAVGKMEVDLQALGIDLTSFSGHKIYGPRGMGVLVVRRRRPRIRLIPLLEGGGQESGLRSGTLNVPGIVGIAKALQLCVEEMPVERQRLADLRDRLFRRLHDQLQGIWLNGPEFSDRLPGNLNLRFDGVDGEALMMNLGEVAVSSGSACTSANPEPSHVLRAIGLSEDQTRSSLRFGIGRFNTQDDIDVAVETVVAAVRRLRGLMIGQG